MTRSQRLAALAAGAILLVGIPVSGAHQVPPPDLGEPVVVGRMGPHHTSGSVPSPDGRATERAPTRSPSPGATTGIADAHEDEYGGEDAVASAPNGAEQADATDPDRTDTAQPVSPKPPVPAGDASDDDRTPTYSPAEPATPGTPSTPAGDDGDDDDTGEDG
ncbi:hypothetical protein QFZ82_001992 [Streptomyces sp. V4I23]|uniref:hypothetical protein n=1 Tax=Streptomyces sp. V4I23 TaxID=3042282 RepID=UPI00278443DC|nr:hypothetical protein [Streptomyces sp. V4I23]MDQ1007507.1 hypothetical protein [Streptomyces sp. V4I23]